MQPFAATRSRSDPLRQVTAPITRWRGSAEQSASDELVVEEPLEVRAPVMAAVAHGGARTAAGAAPVEETIAVIMRTPGNDEELAAGFLFGEGLLAQRDELMGFAVGLDADGLPSANVLVAQPAVGVDLVARMHAAGYSRQFAVNASCGICGKNSVAAACSTYPRLPAADFDIAPDVLYRLPDVLRARQRVFGYTGGLHGAGIFDAAGTLLALREDIGRHNAVDKLVGRAWLDGTLPLRQRVLLVSGRLSFEIVLKALAAGISVVAAVSAPSSLAVDLAETGGMTLVAFLRGAGMNVYTHAERIRGGTPR